MSVRLYRRRLLCALYMGWEVFRYQMTLIDTVTWKVFEYVIKCTLTFFSKRTDTNTRETGDGRILFLSLFLVYFDKLQ